MAQQMPLPLTISCSSKSRLVLPSWFLPFWCLLSRVVPNKFQKSSKTIVCVCVCVCVCVVSISRLFSQRPNRCLITSHVALGTLLLVDVRTLNYIPSHDTCHAATDTYNCCTLFTDLFLHYTGINSSSIMLLFVICCCLLIALYTTYSVFSRISLW